MPSQSFQRFDFNNCHVFLQPFDPFDFDRWGTFAKGYRGDALPLQASGALVATGPE
jgi:hypothetical protein